LHWQQGTPADELDEMGAERRDVVVAGGGIVGVSMAYELSCLGASVTVIDAGRPGRATDAGAGILSPATAAEEDREWWEMGRACGRHYPNLLSRLGTESIDTTEAQFAVCGVLSIGLRPHEENWFAPFARLVMTRSPADVHEIGVAEARSLFPPLGPVHRVLYHQGAARVDGRGMAAALRRAGLARGVEFLEGEVSGIVTGRSGTVRSVSVVAGDEIECSDFVVSGGAWSAAMGEWLNARLPISPMKGQIVHLGTEGDTGRWPIAQPLLSHYLVPWPDGRVACGGTFEASAGFDSRATVGGLHELLRECLTVAPGLGGASSLQTRVGLRPTAVDDRAVVGLVPGWTNAWVVTGHGANGLLQGPYSARVLAHRIAHHELPHDELPLPLLVSPERFR
jgi:D-amino-acid dehydrogenase